MKALTCAAVRRRLGPFHDNELSFGDQIAVGAHVEACERCAAELAELQLLRQMVRAAAPGRSAMSEELLDADAEEGLQAAVMMRLEAEEAGSLQATFQELFSDRQIVFAGLTAAAAMLACVLSLTGIMRFGTTVNPDSLSALIKAVPPPGSNENPVTLDGYVMMPWALDRSLSNVSTTEGESEVMFVAVVTREGTIANLELHHTTSSKAAENLMGAVSDARFEPARVDGLPVAVNMIGW